MALDNLSFFNAMNREEVKPPFPHPHRPLTSQEAHFAIMEKVNACIQEVNHFEQRVRVEIDNFMDRANVENTAFKEAIQASYNAFMETVQREINNFEVDIQNNFDIYRNDVDKRIADFQTAINNEFKTLQSNVVKVTNEKIAELEALKIELNKGYTDYKNAMLDIVNNFKTTVTDHMESQDNKIEEYKNYMVDNILESTEKVFDKKAQNGEISAIMSAVYGNSRVFKGSLSYDEIQAITDASNGDYYYCTSDEHYYQRTENAWIDIGTGEMIADSYVKFVEAFNNGSAFKTNTIPPVAFGKRKNLIDNNTPVYGVANGFVRDDNKLSGTIPLEGAYYIGFNVTGITANNSYLFGVKITADEQSTVENAVIASMWSSSTWQSTHKAMNSINNNEKFFIVTPDVDSLKACLRYDNAIRGKYVEVEFFLFDVTGCETAYSTDNIFDIEAITKSFVSVSDFSVNSFNAEKALKSDYAITSDNSKYSDYAEKSSIISYPFVDIKNDDFANFHSVTNEINYPFIDYTTTEKYGGFFITLPEMYEEIIVVIDSDKDQPYYVNYLNSGSSWAGVSGYAKLTPYNGRYIGYAKIKANENSVAKIGFNNSNYEVGTTHNINVYVLNGQGVETLDFDNVKNIVDNVNLIAFNELEKMKNSFNAMSNLPLYGKKILCIGDSITVGRKWQSVLAERGAEITTHALGGASIVAPFIGTTNSNGSIEALKISDVCDKDYIVILLGYNNRNYPNGEVGDLWQEGETMTTAGCMQFIINRLYELLGGGIENEIEYNSNLTCKVLIVTPHCAGKYPYNNVDGYGEYPVGSGQTMETLSNIIRDVAQHNNIAVCDLWHNSGINKFTWSVFGANSEEYIEVPSNTSTPYPHNGDQLHCSELGYIRIGETILKYLPE